jgi:transcriptional regulator with XRE-family HTH domain
LTLLPIGTEFTDIAAQKDSGNPSFSSLETTRKPEMIQEENVKPAGDEVLSRAARLASTDLNSIERLTERLSRGPDARAQFVDSQVNKGIALQIRALRDRQGISQIELAEKTGMNQNAISRLESPRRGRPTISTLKRLAEALDVALVVRFVPFSQYAKWYSGIPYVESGISTESLAVPNFTEETRSGALSFSSATHQWFHYKPNPTGVEALLSGYMNETPVWGLKKGGETPKIPSKPAVTDSNLIVMERLNG